MITRIDTGNIMIRKLYKYNNLRSDIKCAVPNLILL